MAEKPTVSIAVYDRPDGGIAVISTPSMKDMMSKENRGQLTPAAGAAIFALTMLLASERHSNVKKSPTSTNEKSDSWCSFAQIVDELP